MSLEREVLTGIAASPGIAIGRVTVFDRRMVPVSRRRIAAEDVPFEVARLEAAMEAARREVETVRDALPADAGADHRLLLETQLMMHGDALLLQSASEAIREARMSAEWALRRTVDEMRARLLAAPEPYFRERADDVGHVGEHILRVLTGASRALPELAEPTILVAGDLSPAEAAQLPAGMVTALVTDAGSASSHTAILARALQVPAVVGVTDVTRVVGPGDVVIVDALRGEVVVRPIPRRRSARGRGRSASETSRGRLRATERAPETQDGERVALLANVELELDVGHAKREGADGIGLYRTEFLYLDRREPPSEEEQTALYERVVMRIAPRPVVFRTFDLGADKLPHGMRRGPNPELGIRGVRVAFERPELLVTQLRALLRASVHGAVQVMFPMVAGVEDLRRAKALFVRAREELEAAGVAFGPVMVGSMLEVPSAVLMADRLAHECDFFSIGTNDLTQYTLAVDRTDPRVAHLARALDPAVLRLLDHARRVAEDSGKPISICGDLAADPVATPVLMGLGFTSLSMPMVAIPLVREVVARIDRQRAKALASDALGQPSAREVERLVAECFGEVLSELWEEHGIQLPRH
ncbi:MAG: phosphoenolpyruvate--protein phosphotransferase [Sandaracinaceae bacterium]|nr:phosphoenolpyruvate--protein phosphotransferase [Sandaracinaceae bacterium]